MRESSCPRFNKQLAIKIVCFVVLSIVLIAGAIMSLFNEAFEGLFNYWYASEDIYPDDEQYLKETYLSVVPINGTIIRMEYKEHLQPENIKFCAILHIPKMPGQSDDDILKILDAPPAAVINYANEIIESTDEYVSIKAFRDVFDMDGQIKKRFKPHSYEYKPKVFPLSRILLCLWLLSSIAILFPYNKVFKKKNPDPS